MFVALFLGNVVILTVGTLFITKMEYFTRINTKIIIPIILVLAVAGAFTLRTNWFDVLTLAVFGVVGYYMFQHNYSIVAFILGIVLGPIAEENFLRSLDLSGGSYMIFVGSWSSRLLVLLTAIILLGPFLKSYLE